MSTPTTTGDQILTSSLHSRRFIYDARYQADGRKKPVIVFVHGFKGFKDWGTFTLIADEFARQGYVFAKLNLSHNGTTPEHPLDFVDLEAFGHNNFILELDDLSILINELEEGKSPIPAAEMDPNRLALIGHSRGGGLVLLKGAEDPRVKAVVTWAAIHNLEQRWPKSFLDEWKEKGVVHIPNARTGQQMPLYYQLVENFRENKERLDIPAAVARMQQPLLVIHGTGDETLPSSMAHEIASWKKGSELLILPDANHTFGGAHPWPGDQLPADTTEVIKATAAFLQRHLNPRS
ncbi:alpha/beta hydrolase family protein [Cesiribacter andamanensis]|uniref:Putative dienelactone hydrolase n=1 Tax=Cesiribacter andamanensis AMV16 TaxID=1279009 RepID=M7N8E1_9BACT|nr:alpha/beta fold hydrolase [Cesiribacter andamanensis]EMR03532.1 putative dienelactone hydrolase [Cesiribacter andamanensis AMV16]